jgi:hypothetical protein
MRYNRGMNQSVWDYDQKKLKKSKSGKAKLLERLINFGIYKSDKQKISLASVKKNWNSLLLEPKRKKLLKLLIWGH